MDQTDVENKAPGSHENMPLKPLEIIQHIKAEQPGVLAGVPDKKAARLVRLAMEHLAAELRAVEAGAIRVPGLGVFRVRQVERTKDGEMQSVRRIVFTPTKLKPKA